MATQARVSSTEALESFRASLIVYLDKARRALDTAGDEVKRTRMWLQQDQRMLWEGEIRRRKKKLDQLQQELMSARMAANSESAVMVRQAAVSKLQREILEAEDKLRRVRKWSQSYDSTVDPVAKRLENLRQILDADIPKAITYLATAQKTLEAYGDMAAPVTDTVLPSAPSAESEVKP